MNFSLKQLVFLAGIAIVWTGLVFGITRHFAAPDAPPVAPQHAEYDSTATMLQAQLVRQSALLDSLRQDNRQMASDLKRSRQQIASYSRINARLNLAADQLRKQVDSLRLASLIIVNPDGMPALKDTSWATSRTFGDSLFRVQVVTALTNGFLKTDIALQQLRQLQISVATTVASDQSGVSVWVSSRDFVAVDQRTYTALKPRQKGLPWGWIGFGAGVLSAAILLK